MADEKLQMLKILLSWPKSALRITSKKAIKDLCAARGDFENPVIGTVKNMKQNIQNERIKKWNEKRMYGQFLRDTSAKVDKELIWRWLSKSDLKIQTQSLVSSLENHLSQISHR